MAHDDAVFDRNQRYLSIAVGSQLIDQPGFRWRWECCFDNGTDGGMIGRFFGTDDHAAQYRELIR